MIRFAPVALALAFFSGPVAAEAVLAEFRASSGSLPPEYAWDVSVTIHADGKVILTHCKGYATEPPGCRTRKGKAEPEKLEGIRAAVVEADLIARPASASNEVIVGGGAVSGSVTIDGETRALPAFPTLEDANRVGLVKSAIYAAIPPRLARKFIEGN